MHKCKYCGAQLSKLDKEICPFCGGKKPLEGTENVTEDFTKSFGPLFEENKDVKPKSKLLTIILTLFVGFLGIQSLYLGYKRNALVTFLISAATIGGVGSILFFTGAIANAFAFLIPYFANEVLMIGFTLFYLTRPDIKDARGEFLR